MFNLFCVWFPNTEISSTVPQVFINIALCYKKIVNTFRAGVQVYRTLKMLFSCHFATP